MKKSKTLFDHLKAITKEQDPNYWNTLSDEDKKSWSSYMINRFLSMHQDWTEIVDRLQYVTQIMEPKEVYLMYIGLLPKTNKFLKYIKASKDGAIYHDWLVDLVATHYEVGKSHAIEYLDVLYASDEGRDSILYLCELYGIERNKIKTLKLGKK